MNLDPLPAQPDAGLTLFAGRFGSGKTEAALNYAVALAEKLDERPVASPWCPAAGQAAPQPFSSVLLVDLDIVTPYFRSREMADSMRGHGVRVVAPAAVSQHLDIPAISPQILGAIQQREWPVVIDVGGDPQGARALGQFSAAIAGRPYTMYFVVNPYRPFTATLDGVARSVREIEATSRLQVTSLVGNPNLMYETTAQTILDGYAQIEHFAHALGLPLAFMCIERRWAAELAAWRPGLPLLILDRHVFMGFD